MFIGYWKDICEVFFDTKRDPYQRLLTSVTIPESVTSIGVTSFSYFTLMLINYKGNLAQWLKFDHNYSNLVIANGGELIIAGEKIENEIVIPEGATSIGAAAFSGCSRLTSIIIPEGVTSIGAAAFFGCSGLTTITIPESVTSIGSSAFSGCSRLTSITIPEGVTSIESYAFNGCRSLTSVTIIDKESTCTHAGSRHKECTECHTILEFESIDAVNHEYGEWKRDVEPTKTTEGHEYRECDKCKHREERSVPKLENNTSGKNNKKGCSGTINSSNYLTVVLVMLVSAAFVIFKRKQQN